jgi:hypothetical protein
MTGPQRRVRRHQRNRASRAWVFGTAGLAAAAAAVGVAAVLVTSGGTRAVSHPTSLATNITGTQAVGVANPGPAQGGGSSAGSAVLLSESQAGLTFTPGGGGGNVQPSQQWQADQMGGGAYILVFTPAGQCLATTGTKRSATAVLARCDLGLAERWYHPYLGTDPAGRAYWQLRSAANGRCLTVGGPQPDGGTGVTMPPCSSSMPWQQLINFFTAY